MDLTRLFQCSLMEEFDDIMSNSVKSMSVDSTSEWWAQRTRLDTKMKVKHVAPEFTIFTTETTILYKTVEALLMNSINLYFNHNHPRCTKENYSIGE